MVITRIFLKFLAWTQGGLVLAWTLLGGTPKEKLMQIFIEIRCVSMGFVPVLHFFGRETRPASQRAPDVALQEPSTSLGAAYHRMQFFLLIL